MKDSDSNDLKEFVAEQNAQVEAGVVGPDPEEEKSKVRSIIDEVLERVESRKTELRNQRLALKVLHLEMEITKLIADFEAETEERVEHVTPDRSSTPLTGWKYDREKQQGINATGLLKDRIVRTIVELKEKEKEEQQ